MGLEDLAVDRQVAVGQVGSGRTLLTAAIKNGTDNGADFA